MIGEEKGVGIARGVGARAVEGHPCDRRTPGGAALARYDRRGVVVGEDRTCDRAGRRIQVLADRQVQNVKVCVASCAFIARPAEVLDRHPAREGQLVDLFPRYRADVADPDVVRAGPDREAEGIPEAVADHPVLVGVRAAAERVIGESRPGRGVYAEDRSVQHSWLTRRPPQALASKRSASGRRRGHRATHSGGRIAAWILRRRWGIAHRPPELAIVGIVEARAFPCADVEHAVGSEPQVAQRMAWELLAPVVDEHLLGAGHHVAQGLEPREAAADDAAVRGGAGVRRAAVGPERCHAPDRRVVCVEHVDVRIGGKVWGEGDAHQPAVPEVVDVRAQVGKQGRRNVRQAAIHEDPTALLRDEDPTVVGETHAHRVCESAQCDRVREVGGQRGRAYRGQERSRRGNGRGIPSAGRIARGRRCERR